MELPLDARALSIAGNTYKLSAIISGFDFAVVIGSTYVINVARRHPTSCLPSKLYR